MTDDLSPATPGPLSQLLQQVGARDLQELTRRPLDGIIAALGQMPIPASEAVLGAVVVAAVDDMRDATRAMHEATKRLDTGTAQLLALTKWLVCLAALTLGAALVTLILAAW